MSVSEKLEEYQHARIYIYTCMYEHPRLVFRAPSFPSTTQLLCERSIPINSSSYTLFEENKEEENEEEENKDVDSIPASCYEELPGVFPDFAHASSYEEFLKGKSEAAAKLARYVPLCNTIHSV